MGTAGEGLPFASHAVQLVKRMVVDARSADSRPLWVVAEIAGAQLVRLFERGKKVGKSKRAPAEIPAYPGTVAVPLDIVRERVPGDQNAIPTILPASFRLAPPRRKVGVTGMMLGAHSPGTPGAVVGVTVAREGSVPMDLDAGGSDADDALDGGPSPIPAQRAKTRKRKA